MGRMEHGPVERNILVYCCGLEEVWGRGTARRSEESRGFLYCGGGFRRMKDYANREMRCFVCFRRVREANWGGGGGGRTGRTVKIGKCTVQHANFCGRSLFIFNVVICFNEIFD